MPQLRLVAPWKEAEALLEDERRSETAMETFENMCRTVPWQAAETVFRAVSVEDDIGYRAVERELLVIRDLEETAPRLRLRAEDVLAEARLRGLLWRLQGPERSNFLRVEGSTSSCPRPPDRPGWRSSRVVGRGEIQSELGAVTSWPARGSTCLLR